MVYIKFIVKCFPCLLCYQSGMKASNNSVSRKHQPINIKNESLHRSQMKFSIAFIDANVISCVCVIWVILFVIGIE